MGPWDRRSRTSRPCLAGLVTYVTQTKIIPAQQPPRAQLPTSGVEADVWQTVCLRKPYGADVAVPREGSVTRVAR